MDSSSTIDLSTPALEFSFPRKDVRIMPIVNVNLPI